MEQKECNGLADVLKKYLKHIVYIDDMFEVTWDMQEDIPKKPPRSSRRKNVDEGLDGMQTAHEKGSDGLENFCRCVQRQFPDILLSPILYGVEQEENHDALLSHMINAHLLILDWKLMESDGGTTAVDLLQKADFTDQLRFCVIYTSNLAQAMDDLASRIDLIKEKGWSSDDYQGKQYRYARGGSVIYMVCEKKDFNFDEIIEGLCEIFVKVIGYFPIAFLDMISRLEGNVPRYLNQFSKPFDKLMLLQTTSDGLPIEDVYQSVNNMVVNTLKGDILLNEQILQGIYEEQVNQLEQLLQNDALLEERWKQCVETVILNISCLSGKRKKELQVLRELPYTVCKETIKKITENRAALHTGYKNAAKYFTKQYAQMLVEKLLQNTDERLADSSLKKTLREMYIEKYDDKVHAALPVCLLFLLGISPRNEIEQLVLALSTYAYGDEERTFEDIFKGCYDIDDERGEMVLQKKSDGSLTFNLLQNKLYPGDIVFKQGAYDECWLCITPACHLLRPKKVDGMIQFVRGIISDLPSGVMRDSEHLTILPGVSGSESPICVKWQCHDIVSIDLKKIAISGFKEYYRPYRLNYEYVQQIMGKFIAFYSKSGVDELFIKSDPVIYDLLIG